MGQKEKDPELCVSEAWAFEQGMLKDAKVPDSKKAAYLIARWEDMVFMSVSEAKEWLARFGDTASEDDKHARSMLERYISISTGHANRLDAIRQEYLGCKTREELEKEHEECERRLESLRDAMSAEFAKSYVRGMLNEQIAISEQRMKEIDEELKQYKEE